MKKVSKSKAEQDALRLIKILEDTIRLNNMMIESYKKEIRNKLLDTSLQLN